MLEFMDDFKYECRSLLGFLNKSIIENHKIITIHQSINNQNKISKNEYAVNSVEMIKEVILLDFDSEEKIKVQEFLKKSDVNNPVILDNNLFPAS